MKSADRAAGAVRFLPVMREHQRGTPVTFHHASSRDPDDAPVPAVPVDDHAMRVAEIRFLFEPFLDGFENAAFLLLSFSIELIKSPGDLAGTRYVFHAK